MSYTLKPNPPCRGCENRHERCHTKCPEYIEWNEKRQAKREIAYKNRRLEAEADEYQISRSEKYHKRCR